MKPFLAPINEPGQSANSKPIDRAFGGAPQSTGRRNDSIVESGRPVGRQQMREPDYSAGRQAVPRVAQIAEYGGTSAHTQEQ